MFLSKLSGSFFYSPVLFYFFVAMLSFKEFHQKYKNSYNACTKQRTVIILYIYRLIFLCMFVMLRAFKQSF